MEFTTRQINWMIGLFFGGLLFFLVNIQYPITANFDEFHYVPSAKQFLQLTKNQNYEHPPLGKLVMAAGIALFGDEPLGWRFMSTLFGALTLSGMFAWALAVFGELPIAIWVALITVVNQLLYVQSRIGMLDTPMMAFLAWGLAAISFMYRRKSDPSNNTFKSGTYKLGLKTHYFAGLMFGLAAACKWYTLFPFAAIWVYLFIQIYFRRKATVSDLSKKTFWWAWTVVPLAAYYFTFLPFLFLSNDPHSIWDILGPMQYRMFDGQMRVVNSHPYMSQWWEWPILRRPIWYAFDKEKQDEHFIRGVILLGNPAVMWCGVLAWLSCVFYAFARKTRESILCAASFAILFFCWVAIPRKVAFYYYYYPSGMALSLCLAHQFFIDTFENKKFSRWFLFGFTAVAIGLFIYFFPILAALKIPSDAYQKYMWQLGFNNWI